MLLPKVPENNDKVDKVQAPDNNNETKTVFFQNPNLDEIAKYFIGNNQR
jgi:hypothetical protein